MSRFPGFDDGPRLWTFECSGGSFRHVGRSAIDAWICAVIAAEYIPEIPECFRSGDPIVAYNESGRRVGIASWAGWNNRAGRTLEAMRDER